MPELIGAFFVAPFFMWGLFWALRLFVSPEYYRSKKDKHWL